MKYKTLDSLKYLQNLLFERSVMEQEPTNSPAKHYGGDLATKTMAQDTLLPGVGCFNQLTQLQVPLVRGICVMPAPCQDDALFQEAVFTLTNSTEYLITLVERDLFVLHGKVRLFVTGRRWRQRTLKSFRSSSFGK